ncbi:nitroreductase family protein [Sphingomonas sp. NFR15]|uniref:Acg family FMN-binding oxidoreductase n=1 Tax=Sphingomonas sp. NFR15 TaxID=1566282 RepID=UPI00087EFB07|nr:nitroreductase family protein [Sphingomonas sp. NFR15]SDA10450.1 Nitroreductase family protein [Sphingomonas sp. NFR15]
MSSSRSDVSFSSGTMMMNRRQMLVGGGLVVAGAGGAAALDASRTGSMADYTAAVAAERAPLGDRAGLLDLVRYAALAPSGHNVQPWRFQLDPHRIGIRPDYSRRTPAVDPDDHHLFVSLGCALENLVLAAAARGRGGAVWSDLAGSGQILLEFAPGRPESSPLFEAIPRRQSTRAEYDGHPAAVSDLKALEVAAEVRGVDVIIATARAQIESVLDLVVAGNRAQMADRAFLRELRGWLRFNPRSALASGDGLFSVLSGNPIAPTWLGRLMFDLAFRVDAENDKYARQLRSSAGIAIFVARGATRESWVQAGRACQRFALQATALGMKCAFVNQPVEVPALRGELARWAGLPDRRPDIVMRFGHGSAMPFSARRPVSAIVSGAASL